jgi:site-specific DNA-methyltransferase (adenine-specific)
MDDDCMELMDEYPDNHFELAIVDPPYFNGPNLSGYFGKGVSSLGVERAKYYSECKYWSIPDEEYFKELKRVSKNQIIWGANHFSDNFNSSSSSWIVWDKENGDSCFADAELAYTSFKGAVRICRIRWSGMLQHDMKNKEVRIHPTQKPKSLYKWLLQNYAKPGDKILDTHLGSGSIAIACHEMGFKLTGSELDPEYFQKIINRIEIETQQQDLFT